MEGIKMSPLLAWLDGLRNYLTKCNPEDIEIKEAIASLDVERGDKYYRLEVVCHNKSISKS